jgi:uncharacterized protein (TIGR02001 family)
MKTVVALSVIAAGLLPTAAAAEGLTFGGGISVTSNSLSDGLSDTTNGPAIQPFFEIGKNGFYAGVWASNLKDADDNRAELDIYGGYRGETAAGLAYDLGYTQQFYDKTRDFAAEFAVSLGVPVTDYLTVTGEVSYDLAEKTFGQNIGAEFTPAEAWTLHAAVGRADPEASVNWGAGVTYAFDDRTGLDLQYQDTETTKGLVALTLTYAIGDVEK